MWSTAGPGLRRQTRTRNRRHGVCPVEITVPAWRVSRHSGVWDPGAYCDVVGYEVITVDPNRMSGLPCIRDTRVTVSAVLGQLAAGLTIPEVLADFPYLDRADVLAALEYAAAAVQERELPLAQSA